MLRPLGESEMQTVLDTPAKELPAVPVEHKAHSSSMGQTAVSYLAESRFAKSRGMTPGITLGHLGHNGCLANPDDLAAAIAGYEGLLTLYASRLALCEGVAEILKLETLSVEEAKVWATARGPQPLPWEAKRRDEPAYSTSARKRAIARGLRNLIAHSLGGEEGFVRWIVDEMERSQGRKGVLKDKRIFGASFLQTLLESDKLHAELKRLIERRGRPTLLRFAVATSSIRQRDVNKLRELQPGFYPGPNKIRQGKRTHLGAFLRDVCSGGWSPVSMTTGLSEAAEAEERERRLALDREQADADDAGLVAEARRELEAAAEGESSGSESEGVNEWESDGEQEPTPAEVEADKAVGKGYGVEDMRDAHQAMIFVNLAFTVAEPGTKSSQLVCKLTEDKANFDYLSRAGLKSATSAQLEYISQGVIGPDMVDHQLTCAQSSRGAFPLVKTRAGDSRPQARVYSPPDPESLPRRGPNPTPSPIVPTRFSFFQIEIDLVSLMEQQDSIDKYGLENVALLSQLPPVIITFGNTADELSTMSGYAEEDTAKGRDGTPGLYSMPTHMRRLPLAARKTRARVKPEEQQPAAGTADASGAVPRAPLAERLAAEEEEEERLLSLGMVARLDALCHVPETRIVLALNTSFRTVCLQGGDGAYLMQLTGVTVHHANNQFFNLEPKTEAGLVYHIVVLPKGTSPREWVEQNVPPRSTAAPEVEVAFQTYAAGKDEMSVATARRAVEKLTGLDADKATGLVNRFSEGGATLSRAAMEQLMASLDHEWYLELLLMGMREDDNLSCSRLTREPEKDTGVRGETEPDREATAARRRPQPRGGKRASKAAAQARDSRGAGQNTTAERVRPWLDPKLQAIGYEHKDFSPARDAFDGALEGAADRRLPCDVAMRVPIIHGEIARDLSGAPGRYRLTPLERVLVPCTLHLGMRTGDSGHNLLFAARGGRGGGRGGGGRGVSPGCSAPQGLREAYHLDKAGSGARKHIDGTINAALRKGRLRYQIRCSQEAAPQPMTLNGQETRWLESDYAPLRGLSAGERQAMVQSGKFTSTMVQAYYDACVACNMDVEDLDEIMEVMSLWSIVSEISRQMKPDAAQRREFRRACRLYRARKMHLWGRGNWYDRMMHVLPTLLDRYYTLGAVNQQSMEGNQHRTQLDLRHAPKPGGGRPSRADRERGAEAWAEKVAARKAGYRVEKWMWEEQVWHFITEKRHALMLALVDHLKAKGQVIESADLNPLWRSYRAAYHCVIRWVARKRRRRGAALAEREYPS